MNLSKNKLNEAKRLGIKPEWLIAADLITLGYTEDDAFEISHSRISMTKSALQNDNIKREMLGSPVFRKALEARMDAHMENASVIGTDSELIDKTQTAKLIMKAAMKQPNDSKERIEGLMKYADIMGYKKDDVEAGTDDSISFFLPLKCDQCPLLKAYNKEQERQGGETIRPVEMGRVIKAAKSCIEKTKKKSAEA
ncbi:MAG: hypothetical protein II495_01790 [Paludibacteraceae bacterium]|nr:hypothetical protein [Paludibacteraceae bacterium]